MVSIAVVDELFHPLIRIYTSILQCQEELVPMTVQLTNIPLVISFVD